MDPEDVLMVQSIDVHDHTKADVVKSTMFRLETGLGCSKAAKGAVLPFRHLPIANSES